MVKAHKLLEEFFEERGMKQNVFAKKIGTSTCTLFNILKLGHIPNINLCFQIEKITKGKIDFYDWVEQVSEKDKDKNTA